MNIAEEKKRIEAALDEYRRQLDSIPDEVFDQALHNGGWSFSEVYSHILQSDFGSMIAAEKCARKTSERTNKGLNFFGVVFMLAGRFPPVRSKAPAGVPVVKKISKEEARNLIIRVRDRLNQLVPLLPGCSNNYKIKHPRLGRLSALQWLKFTRIHTEHHLKQLERVRKVFMIHA